MRVGEGEGEGESESEGEGEGEGEGESESVGNEADNNDKTLQQIAQWCTRNEWTPKKYARLLQWKYLSVLETLVYSPVVPTAIDAVSAFPAFIKNLSELLNQVVEIFNSTNLVKDTFIKLLKQHRNFNVDTYFKVPLIVTGNDAALASILVNLSRDYDKQQDNVNREVLLSRLSETEAKVAAAEEAAANHEKVERDLTDSLKSTEEHLRTCTEHLAGLQAFEPLLIAISESDDLCDLRTNTEEPSAESETTSGDDHSSTKIAEQVNKFNLQPETVRSKLHTVSVQGCNAEEQLSKVEEQLSQLTSPPASPLPYDDETDDEAKGQGEGEGEDEGEQEKEEQASLPGRSSPYTSQDLTLPPTLRPTSTEDSTLEYGATTTTDPGTKQPLVQRGPSRTPRQRQHLPPPYARKQSSAVADTPISSTATTTATDDAVPTTAATVHQVGVHGEERARQRDRPVGGEPPGGRFREGYEDEPGTSKSYIFSANNPDLVPPDGGGMQRKKTIRDKRRKSYINGLKRKSYRKNKKQKPKYKKTIKNKNTKKLLNIKIKNLTRKH